MKMMGLPNWLHWSAWFFKYLVYMNFFAIALTIAFKVHTSHDDEFGVN